MSSAAPPSTPSSWRSSRRNVRTSNRALGWAGKTRVREEGRAADNIGNLGGSPSIRSASVLLAIPHGFKLPPDSAIDDGEKLGQGSITIALAPACSTTETVNVNIVERNRTQAEKNAGVYAVWVVDLHPVTTIDLKIKGNPTNGWKATGAIAPNDATCRRCQCRATINKSSSSSHV